MTDMSPPTIFRETASGDTLTVDFELQETLDVFYGHFPGQPVLPGVVQLHWAVSLAASRFGMPEVPSEILRLKFKSVALPPLKIRLTLQRHVGDEVQFSFNGDDGLYSEGRLRYALRDSRDAA